MRLDGRWDPLTLISQVAALVAVLFTWWRVDRKQPAGETTPHTFWGPSAVSGPGEFYYRRP